MGVETALIAGAAMAGGMAVSSAMAPKKKIPKVVQQDPQANATATQK